VLFDGITLTQGSNIGNLTVSSGTQFPSDPHSGELFFRSDSDTRIRGLYLYISTNWFRVASTDSLSVPIGNTLPALANEADIFYLNSGASSEGVYIFKNSSWVQLTDGAVSAPSPAPSPSSLSSSSSSQKITKTAIALGTLAPNQTGYTWTAVSSVCLRGLMSLLSITANTGGLFNVQIRDAGGGGGDLWFEAIDVDGTSFSVTAPVYIEGSSSSVIFVGIQNRASVTRTFTLSNLRVEKFA